MASWSPGARLQWLTRQRLLPYVLAHDAATEPFALALHAASAVDRARQVSEVQAALAHTLRVLAPLEGGVLVLKGVALGLSCYGDPAWRPVTDIDLLIEPAQRWRAHALLNGAGFRHDGYSQHGGVVHQASYFEPATGVSVDLHWALSNLPELAWRLPYAELAAAALPLPGLDARRLGTSHALIHAAMHYAAHQPAAERPAIWLLDMALLCAALDAAGWAELDQRARAAGLCGLLAAGLIEAAEHFELSLPAERLADWQALGREEPASALLQPPSGAWSRLLSRLRGLPTLRARSAWLLRSLCPPSGWMRGRYQARTPLQLGLAYLRRWRDGMRRLGGR